MNVQTEKNRDKAEKLAYSLLYNTNFDGFKYDTQFSMLFRRNKKADFGGYTLPWTIEIQAFSDWWVDSEASWKAKVESLATNYLVEPVEPVRAYELACLRWQEDSTVVDICFHEKEMIIKFVNGRTISFPFELDEEPSFVIKEPNVLDVSAIWSVTCDDGELYVRAPQNVWKI